VLAKELRASLREEVSRSTLTYYCTVVQEALAAKAKAKLVEEEKKEEKEKSKEREEFLKEVLARSLRVKKLLKELINLLF
jgi:hypothetical protein